MLQLKYISERIYNNDTKKIWKSWSTCVGNSKGKKQRWIVDIDAPLEYDEAELLGFLSNIEPIGDKLITKIPTKSGYHLISKPFNVQKFKEKYQNIDVHKNNPTILYIP